MWRGKSWWAASIAVTPTSMATSQPPTVLWLQNLGNLWTSFAGMSQLVKP